jgi:hypothetical protein
MVRSSIARIARTAVALATLVALVAAAPVSAAAPTLPGARDCPLFPASNVWNRRVDSLPVARNSATIVRTIGVNAYVHPDFGSYSGYGIPYNVVGSSTPRSHVTFRWPGESDAGPYPIPTNFKREGGSDKHILMVDRDSCRLYELFAAVKGPNGWHAGSGAIWNLKSNALRPKGWTSADAAGLPILPGLVRFHEVAAGAIRHALRFTAPETRRSYIYPARHFASDYTNAKYPPMGLRVRLKKSVDISHFGPQARVLLKALKLYGMILADNGSPWYVTGAPDPRWDDDDMHDLHTLHGSDFEVVDTSSLRNG